MEKGEQEASNLIHDLHDRESVKRFDQIESELRYCEDEFEMTRITKNNVFFGQVAF